VNSFEYVLVLVSIVLGLAITRLLAGVGGELIQARDRVQVYWVHYSRRGELCVGSRIINEKTTRIVRTLLF